VGVPILTSHHSFSVAGKVFSSDQYHGLPELLPCDAVELNIRGNALRIEKKALAASIEAGKHAARKWLLADLLTPLRNLQLTPRLGEDVDQNRALSSCPLKDLRPRRDASDGHAKADSSTRHGQFNEPPISQTRYAVSIRFEVRSAFPNLQKPRHRSGNGWKHFIATVGLTAAPWVQAASCQAFEARDANYDFRGVFPTPELACRAITASGLPYRDGRILNASGNLKTCTGFRVVWAGPQDPEKPNIDTNVSMPGSGYALPCEEVREPQDAVPKPKGDLCGGNPIYPLRGSKREVVPSGLRIGRIELSFTYDSAVHAPLPEDFLPRQVAPVGILGGAAWSSNLHRRLDFADGGRIVHAIRGSGLRTHFLRDPAGRYAAGSEEDDRLTVRPSTGEFVYLDVKGGALETYDPWGALMMIEWIGGGSISFEYSRGGVSPDLAPGAGYLLEVRDHTGRTLNFNYGPTGLLTKVIDAAGQSLFPGHGAAEGEGMRSIKWADGKSRQYLYEDLTYPWALTGLVDEKGVRYATFGYRHPGWATSTEHAGGVNRVSVQYAKPPELSFTDVPYRENDDEKRFVRRTYRWSQPEGMVVRFQNGARNDVGVTSIGGVTYLASQSQPAGSGCAPSSTQQSFDGRGNLTSRDDFNGTRTCYSNDPTRSLEVERVEGLANTTVCAAVGSALPTGSRKVSTQWHPDWELETRRAEPGKITTWIYNGQPDPASNTTASCAGGAQLSDGKPLAVVCRQVERATTDLDGSQGFGAELQAGVALRQTQWTYNAQGQVLSEDGPRTDISDVTQDEYHADRTADHAPGDLSKVRDASGVIAEFTKYNKFGQALESKDGNGVVTVNTYDERQRLRTSKTGTEQTTYTYDDVGQLTRVKQPDGSWVGFDYDDAHRLKAMHDLPGNRIEYELDNEGKRKGERVKDPQGTLRRNVIRAMDALGRVQRTTVGQ
jgi:YD repeat-containing protein